MSFLDLFKRKATVSVQEENNKNIKFLYDCVLDLKKQTGIDNECDMFLEYLSQFSLNTSLSEELIEQFKQVVNHVLISKLAATNFYVQADDFKKACLKFNNYATAIKELDGSYSICPVMSNDRLVEYIVEYYLNNSDCEKPLIESIQETNTQTLDNLSHSKINTYYGNLEYIQMRTKAILDGVEMICNFYSLSPDEYQFMEIKKVEANECATMINSVSQDTMTQDIYLNVIHKEFHKLVTIEKELSFISERIWKQYFENRNAKFVHALSGAIVLSDQMPKICTTLYLDDLATIPYGHTGYEYGVQMDNIACICSEDVGSWHLNKQQFLGMDRGGSIMHSWQYDEETNIFYEYGYHSTLLPPDYIEQKARKNNVGSSMNYTEILLLNNQKKIPPLKAFYTEKATPFEIERITSLAKQQGIVVEYIDTQQITNQMKSHMAY